METKLQRNWGKFYLQSFCQLELEQQSGAAVPLESFHCFFLGADQAAVICCVTRADSFIDPAMIQQRHTPGRRLHADSHAYTQAI